MAGFNFTFRCKDDDKDLGRAILRKVQRIARNFELDFRYKIEPDGWYVTVDGPLTSMQALMQPITVQLLPFAEGFSNPKNVRHLRRVVDRFIDGYCDGLSLIREMVEDISDKFGGTPNSYFFKEGSTTHLSSQVREFERSLILFHNGLMSASQFAEEAHTLTESLLKACVTKKNRNGSFVQLLSQVSKTADLDPRLEQTLIKLKDRRKVAKHYGQRVRYTDMMRDIVDLVSALHCLFNYLRKSKESKDGTS